MFDYGVAAGGDVQFVGFIKQRPDVALVGGHFGQGSGYVQLGQGIGRGQQAVGGHADLLAKLSEQAAFDFQDAVFGVEDERFVFFQFGGDVSFGVGQGLFADVILGGQVAVGAGDFNVVAKDFVVTNFQRLEPGPFALYSFEVGDPVPRMLG